MRNRRRSSPRGVFHLNIFESSFLQTAKETRQMRSLHYPAAANGFIGTAHQCRHRSVQFAETVNDHESRTRLQDAMRLADESCLVRSRCMTTAFQSISPVERRCGEGGCRVIFLNELDSGTR